MIKEEIEYINDLGYHKTLTIIPQKDGLYFMAISYHGDVVSFEGNCTKQRVQEFRKKILDHKIILAIKNYQWYNIYRKIGKELKLWDYYYLLSLLF